VQRAVQRAGWRAETWGRKWVVWRAVMRADWRAGMMERMRAERWAE